MSLTNWVSYRENAACVDHSNESADIWWVHTALLLEELEERAEVSEVTESVQKCL
jgi:hypothetical protein